MTTMGGNGREEDSILYKETMESNVWDCKFIGVLCSLS